MHYSRVTAGSGVATMILDTPDWSPAEDAALVDLAGGREKGRIIRRAKHRSLIEASEILGRSRDGCHLRLGALRKYERGLLKRTTRRLSR